MIPFFRKIRKKLADDNQPASPAGRFFKYSRYAIGEIVLVVIGILIALQVNNWNEERKESILQRKILTEIVANIELDILEIQSDIRIMDSVNKACAQVLIHLENEKIPSKDFNYRLASVRANPHFDPIKSGYSLLISKGLDIIQNDNLRENISVLYESNYPYYRRYEDERTQFKIQSVYPLLMAVSNVKYVEELPLRATAMISFEDYDKLRGDKDFEKWINTIENQNRMVQDRAVLTVTRMKDLRDLIKNELNEID